MQDLTLPKWILGFEAGPGPLRFDTLCYCRRADISLVNGFLMCGCMCGAVKILQLLMHTGHLYSRGWPSCQIVNVHVLSLGPGFKARPWALCLATQENVEGYVEVPLIVASHRMSSACDQSPPAGAALPCKENHFGDLTPPSLTLIQSAKRGGKEFKPPRYQSQKFEWLPYSENGSIVPPVKIKKKNIKDASSCNMWCF